VIDLSIYLLISDVILDMAALSFQALFRPMAMMVPDYALFIYIYLYIYIYVDI